MGMRVSTNIAAINAQRNLSTSQRVLSKSMSQLASGSRINIAADDAAGLAISEKLKASIRSARQANRNANDGISMIQTAEGGLSEISNIVIRLRELGMQSASDTVGDTERDFLNKEVGQLIRNSAYFFRNNMGSTKLSTATPALIFKLVCTTTQRKTESHLTPLKILRHSMLWDFPG